MRIPIIVANWKMHKTLGESNEFVSALSPKVLPFKDVEIVIAPPFTALFTMKDRLKSTDINLAAQNIFYLSQKSFNSINPSFRFYEYHF